MTDLAAMSLARDSLDKSATPDAPFPLGERRALSPRAWAETSAPLRIVFGKQPWASL